MQRIRVKGKAAFQSTPAEYMRDMLRYDTGTIEAIWDYPTGKRFESVQFTAIVQLETFTPDRWRSFGLYPDIIGEVGEYSYPGYTVDQWAADHVGCWPFARPDDGWPQGRDAWLPLHLVVEDRDQDGGCPWCGRDCPEAGKTDGCWYQGCPDFPHGM